MGIIIAVILFSAIVLIHELGHFLLAKKNKITVTEFSFGMGPRLVSTVKGGTRYSIKLLPIGGSCAMLGEDMDEDSQGTFGSASVWSRISVVAAGPIFNFILAFVLAVIIVACLGYAPAQVMDVTEGSAAEQAGLQDGDVITEYNGYGIDVGKDLYVYTYLNPLSESDTIQISYERDGKEYSIQYKPDVDVRYLLGFNRVGVDSLEVDSLIQGMPLEEAGVQPGDVLTSINGVELADGEAYEDYITSHPLTDEPVTITYSRSGKEYEAVITPKEYRTPLMGFSYNVSGCIKTEGFEIFERAALEVKYMIRSTILSLKALLSGKLGIDAFSSPVGVVDAIGETYEQTKSEGNMIMWMNMLNLGVLLSANLGVVNLIPFPALDGGRLFFLFLEVIRRKPVNRQLEGMIHFAGLMLLMVFMLVVIYNDVLKIF
ncbi:MAG TPA: RIP metalloprotease RseP [Candidatus Blautia faecigallinarum]|uniref:Zinc metalloprotease n=1 Tax=Candidatus Blautia faecigallinarum TaxID=2838488 RepID=A0A9D2IUJ7_9FIRM|nr:RIP metalloprotease RseP [Candidatus Blautia faecigallinarum]